MTGLTGLGFAMNRTIPGLVTQRLRDSEIRSGHEIPRVSEPDRVGGSPRVLFQPPDAQGDGWTGLQILNGVTTNRGGSSTKEEWSGRQDLNLRRLGPKPSALPG